MATNGPADSGGGKAGQDSQPGAPLEVLPLDKFRAEFMGKQWGLAAEFLVYENRPFTTEQALAFTMLHDVLVRPLDTGERLRLISRIWKAREDFGTEEARWIPYWDTKSPAHPGPQGIMVSLHSRARRPLAADAVAALSELALCGQQPGSERRAGQQQGP